MATVDIKIQNKCDHRILGEPLTLSYGEPVMPPFTPTPLYINAQARTPATPTTYRNTLVIAHPVASTSGLELRRNGVVISPADYVFRDAIRNALNYPYKNIVLVVPDASSDPEYEVSYNTFLQFCPKCNGVGYADDWVLMGTGKPSTVNDTAQLAQAVEKVIVTELGSNKYHTWVGSSITTLIGSKITDQEFLAGQIKEAVSSAMTALQQTQIQHMNANPLVSDNEVLGSIGYINVTFDAADPSVVYVDVSYSSKSGVIVNFSQELELAALRAKG